MHNAQKTNNSKTKGIVHIPENNGILYFHNQYLTFTDQIHKFINEFQEKKDKLTIQFNGYNERITDFFTSVKKAQTIANTDNFPELMINIFKIQNFIQKHLINVVINKQRSYQAKFNFFFQNYEKFIETHNYSLLTYPSGTVYDIGMSNRITNLHLFDDDANLYIEQTLEPIILKNGTILREGLVKLSKEIK